MKKDSREDAKARRNEGEERRCEICGEAAARRTGCSQCGKLVGDCCLAWREDGDEEAEPVCEECF